MKVVVCSCEQYVDMGKIKIQKGVPLPVKNMGDNNKTVKYRPIIEKMGVGDSIVLLNKEYYDFHNATRFDQRFKDRKFTSRKVSETHKRIWRIK